MSNQRNISYEPDKTNLNTLERELSVRVGHPDRELNINKTNQNRNMSIQSNRFDKFDNFEHPKPMKKKQQSGLRPPQPNPTVDPSLRQPDRKIKYVSTDRNNFSDFYSFGRKMGQNYNTEQENDLRFSVGTRRKTLPKDTMNTYKHSSRDSTLDNGANTSDPFVDRNITDLVNVESKLLMSINSNEISDQPPRSWGCKDTASKIPKASAEYWDNTKRRNLDTSTYTNNPMKAQGRGFGNVNTYDVFLNGVGTATRQDNPEMKPRNYEDDRIFMTNHNYQYEKYRVTESLPCGSDTRYLNKKMI